MPIFEQGYRRYDGPVSRSSRALSIAWESVRPRFRWWTWIIGFAFLFWPYVVVGGIVFVGTVMEQSGLRIPQVNADTVFATRNERFRPDALLALLQTAHPRLFWDALNTSFVAGFPLHFTAVCAAGILASDRRTGALQIYFARAVSPRDYLLGKSLATAVFGLVMTCVPSLLLWTECAALSTERSYVLTTWWFPFSIVAASALCVLWCVSVVLLLSSLIDRPVFVAVSAIFVFLFLQGLGWSLSKSMRMPELRVLSPQVALGGLTAPLFGLKTPDWLPWWRCALVGLGAPLGFLAIVRRRLRAVEVVT